MTVIKLIARDIIGVLQKAGILLEHRMKDPGQAFSSHGTDARKAIDDQLFIAYRGVSFDAHAAVPDLQAKHPAMGFIVDSRLTFAALPDSAFACLVSDSREAWAWLAAHHYGNPQDQLRLLAVTGTNGKTSTVWFVRQLLRSLQEPCLIMGTIGVFCGEEQFPATHTTPDPDELFRQLEFAVSKGLRWAAMEVSSHALVQRRIGPLRFDAAAFTSFSRDHLDFHPDMDEYFAAKWQLFTHYLKPKAAAWLAQGLAEWLPEDAFSGRFGFYGELRVGPMARTEDAFYSIKSMTIDATELEIVHADQSWQGRLPFGADFAIANFTAALLMLDGLLPGRLRAQHWQMIQPVPGRFEPVLEAKAHGLAVIVDYAHTPDALEKTLQKLRSLSKGKVWVVFGCGGDRDRGKRPLMGAVAEREADHVVVTSDNPRSEPPESILQEISKGMQSAARHRFIVDRASAIRLALIEARAGDAILIAGKGHEDYQIIGAQRLDFDDRLQAAKILQERPLPRA